MALAEMKTLLAAVYRTYSTTLGQDFKGLSPTAMSRFELLHDDAFAIDEVRLIYPSHARQMGRIACSSVNRERNAVSSSKSRRKCLHRQRECFQHVHLFSSFFQKSRQHDMHGISLAARSHHTINCQHRIPSNYDSISLFPI